MIHLHFMKHQFFTVSKAPKKRIPGIGRCIWEMGPCKRWQGLFHDQWNTSPSSLRYPMHVCRRCIDNTSGLIQTSSEFFHRRHSSRCQGSFFVLYKRNKNNIADNPIWATVPGQSGTPLKIKFHRSRRNRSYAVDWGDDP